ncbi:MAG: hypothetical protein ACP5GK_08030 [Desulfurella sp.]|jgi:hypothetical protein|uniref:hypothetical protein n=1 Tax=Desulfurella sp. TaxID=1962857 RepID=UPI0003E087D5|nr:hypothetical protein [Desulfurella sp.]AHF97775.1 hypothetical protein DESACE_02680 [Desulfurella acetivorans A63]PMP87349.1 MAG: hypothetical protein C0173_09330 [Desulfurella sp.]HEX13838.1 hypothetical protein [Desulfurella acetivorans]
MSFLNKVESKVFFRLVRVFSFFMAFIGLIMLIYALVVIVGNFLPTKSSVEVSFNDVQKAIKANSYQENPDTTNATNSNATTQINERTQYIQNKITSITQLILKKLNLPQDNFENISNNIVSNINNIDAKYQKSYLDGLYEVLEKAPANKLDDYYRQYNDLFNQKINSIIESKMKKQSSQSTYLIIALSGLGVIFMYSIILALLAIERNTRKEN